MAIGGVLQGIHRCFLIVLSPPQGLLGVLLAIEGRGGVQLGCVLQSFIRPTPTSVFFLWSTVVSIEITEAMLKSQGAGSLGKFTAFFSKCQQGKREGLGVSEGVRH